MKNFCLIIAALILFSIPACTENVRPVQDLSDLPAMSSFYQWSSMDIVNAFRKQGLEAADVKPGFIVGVHRQSENTIFMTPSFGEGAGCIVSAFNTKTALKEYKNHYSEINKKAGKTVWRIFKRSNIVLLVSGKISWAATRKYEMVLMDIE